MYSEDLVEEVAVNGRPEEFPVGNVVPSPMSCKVASPYAVAPGDDEGTLALFFEELMGRDSGHVAIV